MRLSVSAAVVAFMVASVAVPHSLTSEDDALQNILVAENERRHDDPALTEGLHHSSDRVVERALEALGRIGDPGDAPSLHHFLKARGAGVRAKAAFALGLMARKESLAPLQARLNFEEDERVQREILLAIGRLQTAEVLPALEASLFKESQSPMVLGAAAEGLGFALLSPDSPQWALSPLLLRQLLRYATSQDPLASRAAFALARYKGALGDLAFADVKATIARSRSAEARALLVRFAQRYVTAPARDMFEALAADARQGRHVRVEALRALGRMEGSASLNQSLCRGARDGDPAVAVTAFETIASNQAAAVAACRGAIEDRFATEASAWVKSAALGALLAEDRPGRGSWLARGLTDRARDVRLTAVRALGRVKSADREALLLDQLGSAHPDTLIAALEALGDMPVESVSPALRHAALGLLAKDDFVIAGMLADLVAKWRWHEALPALVAKADAFGAPDQFEAKVSLLKAIGELGGPAQADLVARFFQDANRQVVEAAAQAMAKIDPTRPLPTIPVNHRVEAQTPSLAELAASLKKRVVIETRHGRIVLSMLGVAPLTAHNFVTLAEQGFFRGKSFHRVVPHFVVQGGDPRGDGWGGPGYLIRDEVSSVSHARGIVGVATSGKDTGGCQLFINHGSNYHLDGKYTAFAKVVEGMNVADKLEVGDVMDAVYVE